MITIELRRELLGRGAPNNRHYIPRYQSTLLVEADPASRSFEIECQIVKWCQRLMHSRREAVDGLQNYQQIAKGSRYYQGNSAIQPHFLNKRMAGSAYHMGCRLTAAEYEDGIQEIGVSLLGSHLSGLAFQMKAWAPNFVRLAGDLAGREVPQTIKSIMAKSARIQDLRS